MRCHSNQEAGSVLIFVIMVALVAGIIAVVSFRTAIWANTKSGHEREKAVAMNIAEAGKERAIARIKGGYLPPVNGRDSLYKSESFQGGSFSVVCSTNSICDTLWIRSYGSVGPVTKGIEADVTRKGLPPFNPKGVRGAVTARDSVYFAGSFTSDGRNHDSSGNALGGNGTYAISTTGIIDPTGSSNYGSFNCSPPTHPHDPLCAGSFEQTISPDSVPSSPEAALGLSPGALNQFICEPGHTYSGQGIFYVTGDAGTVSFDHCSGILIIHNTTGTANLRVTGQGVFKGIIITDDLNKLAGSAQIIGAVMVIGDVTGKQGAGNSDVLYSKYMMDHLSDFCGDWQMLVTMFSWRELQ
jgi:hypothetical protein